MISPLSLKADEKKNISILNYGLYHIKKEYPNYDLKSIIQILQHEDFKLRKKTVKIPAEIGNMFGMVVEFKRSSKNKKIEFEMVIDHPKITHPNGKSISSLRRKLYAETGDIFYIGWEFNAKYECIPGLWSIYLKQNNQTLVQKSFLVFMPEKENINKKVVHNGNIKVYLVQTGVFSNIKYAFNHMKKISKLSFNPCILPSFRNNNLHFIFIAFERTKESAKQTANEFKEKTGLDVYVHKIKELRLNKKICFNKLMAFPFGLSSEKNLKISR